MLTVEQIIGNLLLRHNCVIVPSFGGFVAKQSAATIDYKNGIMLPPGKSVLFNRQLINSDGLLVSEFASENKVLYSVAEENVNYSVSDWNEKLKNGERVNFDRVGYLFYDQEKNICFEQDRFFNLLLESYGLGKVHFVSENDIEIVQHIAAERPLKLVVDREEEPVLQFGSSIALVALEQEEKQTVIIEHPDFKGVSKVWRYIAAAVLLPIGFYSFWIPMNTSVLESGVLSIRDFNPGYHASEGLYQQLPLAPFELKIQQNEAIETATKNLPTDVEAYAFSFDADLYMPVRLPGHELVRIETEPKIELAPSTPTPVVPVKKESPKPAVAAVSAKTMEYVVGSFDSDENAQVQVAAMKAKGIAAYALPENNGKFRVSAGGAAIAIEMASIANKAKGLGFSGWTLKK